MKKCVMKQFLVVLIMFIFAAPAVLAQEPDDKLSLTFDGMFRTRYEYLVNNNDIGYSGKDEKGYFRFKFTGGMSAAYGDLAAAYIRFATESRSYMKNAGGPTNYDINEVVIDNLFLLFPRLLGTLEIKVGRMDLNGSEYGEGFLIVDGTPLEGSKTFYFNAAKFKYHGMKNSIEFLTIYNPEFDDLPVINDKDQRLNSSTEMGAVLYGRVHAGDNVYLEPYYMWKKEDKAKAAKVLTGETHTNTFGSYVRYKYNDLTLRAQAALQAGDYDDETRFGYGGYIFADYFFSKYIKPQVGFMYLSGDDGDTKEQEAWNPLFSRGNYMSEIAASLYTYEAGYGYWTNLQLYNIEAQSKPVEKLTLKATYMHLKANETVINSASNIFGTGKTRGDVFVFKAIYDFSKNFSAFVWGEYFIPGDFYYDDAKDAVFFRAEACVRI